LTFTLSCEALGGGATTGGPIGGRPTCADAMHAAKIEARKIPAGDENS